MRFHLFLFFVLSLNIAAFAKDKPKKATKAAFKVLKTDKNARKIGIDDLLMMQIKGILISSDSVMFDSYTTNKPFNLPANEVTLSKYLVQLKKGDIAVFSIIADSLFKNIFKQPLTPAIKKGEFINFTVTVLEAMSKEELEKKRDELAKLQAEKNKEYLIKDSVEVAKYIAGLDNVMISSSGLKYQKLKSTNGAQAVKGSKVTVTYKGTFVDGKVFDQTPAGAEGLSFELGAHQVINGWDEGIALMKVGESFRLIIPWNLAYGPNGQGTIPPYTTLIFEVTLDKIN